jgi:hypothetical protein
MTTGKNIWRLCKVYGRLIDCPTLKPDELRHGDAMEALEQHQGPGEGPWATGSLGDTAHVYAHIGPHSDRQVGYRVGFDRWARRGKNCLPRESR